MSQAWQFYIITLLVYLGVNLIAAWSLNLQYGVAGIQNFAFIVFQSIGAYVAGILTIGPHATRNGELLFFSTKLPWPIPIIVAGLAGAALAAIVGSFALRRLNRELQAIVMIMVVIIATYVVEAQGTLLNGSQGIDAVPQPFAAGLGFSIVGYGWFYAGLTAAFAIATYFVVQRITNSPYGRTLRAIRENSVSAEALSVNVRRETMVVFIVGGAIAAVSGAILVEFVGAWAPASWGIAETFLYLAALTVGGLGNNLGALIGSAVVLVGIIDGVEYLPNIGSGSLTGALEMMGVGVLLVGFLWFRPQGILPERRRRIFADAVAAEQRTALHQAAPPLAVVPDQTVEAAVGAVRSSGAASPAETGVAPRRDVLVVDGVSRRFGGLQAVDDVSFAVPEGSVVGLIGPNGAGKSTLINLIAGLDHPESGTIAYDGHDITRMPSHRIAGLGLVRTFQLSSEFKRLTVMENLLVAAKSQRGNSLSRALAGRGFWGRKERENVDRARALLQRFELTRLADDYAGELSGGQKRLLEIARALMAGPRMLVLDEPLAGVAPGLREGVERHLMALRDEGLTLLMCEHDLDTVERCTDLVVVMALGRVLATGTMAQVREREEVVDAYLVG